MKKISIGYFIIASAIVWGVVVIACAKILGGTPYKEGVIQVLSAGTVFHLLFIWGPLAARIGKLKKDHPE